MCESVKYFLTQKHEMTGVDVQVCVCVNVSDVGVVFENKKCVCVRILSLSDILWMLLTSMNKLISNKAVC